MPREFATGSRNAVSAMRVSGGRGREAPHAMATRGRKKPEGRGPEGAHVAFATNMPSAGPDGPCPRRWGIEIGYKVPRQTRMRTPGRDEGARIFCLVVSPVAHSARAMPHPRRGAGGDDRRIPATPSRMTMLLEGCGKFGARARLGPPRRPPP